MAKGDTDNTGPMANYDIWALGESNLSISGGLSLDGITQGDGSHLVGQTITINTANYEQIFIRDRGRDRAFDDNDGNQRLDGAQTFDGVSYGNRTVIEAEYQLTLYDPGSGTSYTAIAVNINDSSPAYATVEGLSFVGQFPPVGVALQVTAAAEGPGASGQPPLPEGDIASPICFTPGTLIRTQSGERRIENLAVGDLILTRSGRSVPLRWIATTHLDAATLNRHPEFRPVRIKASALGQRQPRQDLVLSPQHRVLLQGAPIQLHFGETEVLAPAVHLVNGGTIEIARDLPEVTYIHLLFDRHEIIDSNGLMTESFHPGPACLGTLENDTRAELLALFPDIDLTAAAPFEPALRTLRRWETRSVLHP